MEQPVIFSTVVDGTKRAFGERLTPELLAKLKGVGMDFHSHQPAYPMKDFLNAFEILAEHLVPDAPLAQRYRQLGHDFMFGYVQTTLGKATLAMGRLIGLRRTLQRLARGLYTTGNYLEAEVVVEGPSSVVVITRVRPQFRAFVTPQWGIIAQYRLGVFDGVFELLGTSGTAELLEDDLEKHVTRFRLNWSI